jgi:hypothetical protein
MDLWEFLTVLMLTFALFMLLAGIFTAYFGSGKSRMIGIVLLVVGLVVGIIWIFGAMYNGGGYIPLPYLPSSAPWWPSACSCWPS